MLLRLERWTWVGAAVCPSILTETGGSQACSPVESADPWPIAKVYTVITVPHPPFLGFGFCFFALLAESTCR